MSVKQLKQLKPAQYRYTDNKKGETNRLSMGIMAQDIEKIWPYESYSILKKSEDNFYQVDYYQLIAPMIKAIQELTEEVEKLKSEKQ